MPKHAKVESLRFNVLREGLILFLLLLVTVIAFWRIQFLDFVNYDDPEYVTENPYVQPGLSFRGMCWAATAVVAQNWHPLTMLSHQLDATLYGNVPSGHHLTNLLLHAINVCLIFLLFRSMTGAVWRSALVAALFAVHPLHVQSVAWVSERKDVLSALFWMLTLMAYVRYVKRPNRARYTLVAVSFIFGLLSKSMVVTLPCVLLLLDYWPLNRFPAKGSPLSEWREQCGRLFREKVPLLALAILAGIITIVTQKSQGAWGTTQSFPLLARVSNALTAYVMYLAKTVWPAGLSVFYPHPQSVAPASVLAGCAVLLATITAISLCFARRYPYGIVGWLWYLGTLAPVIGILQVGAQSMADRYTYLPLIGIFLVFAWSLNDLLGRTPLTRTVGAVIAVGLVLACGVRTWSEVAHWRNSETLWTRALAVTDESYPAHVNLGNIFAQKGDDEQAAAHYARAVALFPNAIEALNNHGVTLFKLGRYAQAAEQFDAALKVAPGDVQIHLLLAVTLDKLGKPADAAAHMDEVARLAPNTDARAAFQRTQRFLGQRR